MQKVRFLKYPSPPTMLIFVYGHLNSILYLNFVPVIMN
ncbi:hypothetical protein ANCCAN_17726 [Ancylostoma caninum]|uniref:Uncharacterized protein n=1 Tax=Ancylostoma caninum TaxID=29170 RepID=A0A368FY23_ANCCA|nr:hypothetical protein ANCCAN_17726 [Ancylostoma caninum]